MDLTVENEEKSPSHQCQAGLKAQDVKRKDRIGWKHPIASEDQGIQAVKAVPSSMRPCSTGYMPCYNMLYSCYIYPRMEQTSTNKAPRRTKMESCIPCALHLEQADMNH